MYQMKNLIYEGGRRSAVNQIGRSLCHTGAVTDFYYTVNTEYYTNVMSTLIVKIYREKFTTNKEQFIIYVICASCLLFYILYMNRMHVYP